MKNPKLVVMAAGLGSRYGGLKQIDPITKTGNIIIDFSIYDAHKAGFKDVVFIIKEELLDTFEEAIGKKTRKFMNVSYVFQSTDNYTFGKVSHERVKPLGTGQAILCCKDILDAPFAVINADDFYGLEAYVLMFKFLTENKDNSYKYAMIGYNIQNTLTDSGHVSRGVCKTDDKNNLVEIVERLQIYSKNDEAMFTLDDGETFTNIPKNTPVSMNFWGFTPDFLADLETNFNVFLDEQLPLNPLKQEFLLPTTIDDLIQANKASVSVLQTNNKWYGVTYQEDKPSVSASIEALIASGNYDGI